MRIGECAPGDILTVRDGFPFDDPPGSVRTVRVSWPLGKPLSGVGCTVLEDFSLEPCRYGFAIAVAEAEVVELIEPSKFPPKRKRGEAPLADEIDPLRLRGRADLLGGKP